MDILFILISGVLTLYTATQLWPAGLSKFEDTSSDMFATLGGDKVRYYVGTAELLGPALLFFSATNAIGMFLIFTVMAPAIYLHLFVWENSPKNALLVAGAALASVMFRALS